MICIVVCPHNVEFNEIVILCLEVSVVKAVFKEGSVVIPVPIVDENVDTVPCGAVYLHLHNVGISFIHVTPKRSSVPLVAIGLLC